jgi:cyclin-dependent kinase 8/11
MRPGDLPAKEGDVFAIKKFKPDKEGDVQTYAGISQSGAREIMVGASGLKCRGQRRRRYSGIIGFCGIRSTQRRKDALTQDQLNRELHHRNLVSLREVILEDKAIYMVFEYAEHDFLVSVMFCPVLSCPLLVWPTYQSPSGPHCTTARERDTDSR